MNSFSKKREEQLLALLNDPQIQSGELEKQLVDFVENEVRAAFIRGLRQGQKPGSARRGATPRSALRAGRIRPAETMAEGS